MLTTRTVLILLIALGLAGCGPSADGQPDPSGESTQGMPAESDESMGSSMTGMMEPMEAEISSADFVPAVKGYFDGEKIYFIHTEASDSDVAEMLTVMMGPDVIVVPALAEIPNEFLAGVYVFTNGIEGGGPLGFQPDIFDSIPGDSDYSPLREVNLVTWNAGAQPRELLAVKEVLDAQEAEEVSIERPGIVVNMPVLTWPDGQR